MSDREEEISYTALALYRYWVKTLGESEATSAVRILVAKDPNGLFGQAKRIKDAEKKNIS